MRKDNTKILAHVFGISQNFQNLLKTLLHDLDLHSTITSNKHPPQLEGATVQFG